MLASLVTTFSPCDWLWNGQWQHGTRTKKPKLETAGCLTQGEEGCQATHLFFRARETEAAAVGVGDRTLVELGDFRCQAPSSAKEGKLWGETKLSRELGTPGDTLIWSTSRQVLHTGWVFIPATTQVQSSSDVSSCIDYHLDHKLEHYWGKLAVASCCASERSTWCPYLAQLIQASGGGVKGIPLWRGWKNTNRYCLTGTVWFESTWQKPQRDQTSVWSTIQPARFQHMLSSQVRRGFDNEGLFSAHTSYSRSDYSVLRGQTPFTGQSGLAVWVKGIYQGYRADLLKFWWFQRDPCAWTSKVGGQGCFYLKEIY